MNYAFPTPTIPFCLFLAIREWCKQYRKERKLKFAARHPERVVAQRHKYRKLARKTNHEKWRARDKANYDRNRDQKLAQKRAVWPTRKLARVNWVKSYAPKMRLNNRARYDFRKQTEPEYKLKIYFRNRLRRYFKSKSFHTMDFVGCSIEQLMNHIESQFLPGMTWDNHTKFGWHIDHKIPCSKFDLTKPEHVKQCFHWTNLQPLWWNDNLKKRDVISAEFGNQQPMLTL